MSLYKKYNISIGDKIVANTDVQLYIGTHLKKGFMCVVTQVTDDFEIKFKTLEEVRYTTITGLSSSRIVSAEFHITSNLSNYFSFTKREENLKILLDEA